MPLVALVYTILRTVVAVAFALSLLVAVVYWAVRRGHLNAFGMVARTTRAVADPVMRPLERRVMRMGGNPQDAPIWLIGAVVVIGLLLLGLYKWVIGLVLRLNALRYASPRVWIASAVTLIYYVLIIALLVRVIGSWIGIGRYHRVGRFAYRLTDWLVEPIRRALPPFGFVDLSPLLAWVALWLARLLIVTLLLQ